MAAKSTLVSTGLSLTYKTGVDTKGNDVNKVKKFSNVKVTSDNQNILDVALALSPLMKYPVSQVLRIDDNSIVNA